MKQITWNLNPLFNSDEDPRIIDQRDFIQRKTYAFINKWRDRTDYLKNPKVLAEALREYDDWRKCCGSDGNEGYYFWLRTTQDQIDADLKAKFSKIEEFGKKIENEIQFFHLRIAKIPMKSRNRFLNDPGLKEYRHFLERIFAESQYLLSESEEKIMNLKAPTSYSQWVRMTSGFLAKEERNVPQETGRNKTVTFSEILSLMNSKQQKVRDAAAGAFNDILARHVDVAESEMNAVLANKRTDDELRGLQRPDLARHISDDMDSETVDALIKSVSDRFDISARFYRLKAKLLKVKKLRYHDRNVEYGSIPSAYPFDKSLRLVRHVVGNLDEEFGQILDGFIANGQFDVYPRKGKVSGAFCSHNLISQPTYILLNHTGKLHDVLTLAHELGHGINNELVRAKQNALHFGTPTSTAEVASTFMEDFVLQEILKRADDELRLSIMMMRLNDEVSTIFRQAACYRFEWDLHDEFRKKGYLSKAEIGGLFRKHMSSYMGPSVEQSQGSENWWVYWGHIRSYFYVYSYAGGLIISKSLQHSVKEQPAFIAKVKEFLSAGLSDSPRNIFGRIGIDITDPGFWHKGLDEVEALLGTTAALAKKMGKLN